MIFYILVRFVLSLQVINKICVCEGACPSDTCENAEQIIVSPSTNLDDEINKIKTTNMEILFAPNTIPFSFSLLTFARTTVSFLSTSELASIKVNIDNEVYANISFSSLSITFEGSGSYLTLKALSLSIKSSSVVINGSSACKISTNSLFIDYNSIQPFSDISINGEKEYSKSPFLMYDITSNNDIQITASESSLIITCNRKSHTFSFTNLNYNAAKLYTSSQNQTVTILKSGSSYGIDLSLDGFVNIDFAEGSWSISDIISITNLKYNILINSFSYILPASISVPSRNVTIIVSQQNTHISSTIIASTVIFNTTYKNPRVTIEVLDELNSNVYLATSYIDLIIGTFSKSSYNFDCPFIFTLGKYGVSSVISNNSKLGSSVTYSTILFGLEFDYYPGDDELSQLIEKNLTLLELNGVYSYSNPSPSFLDESTFIHGFNKKDCLIEINRESSYTKIKYSIYIQSLDNMPLSLCVGNCLATDFLIISKDDLKEITTKYFVPGIKKLIIYIQESIDLINLSNFESSQTNLDIQLIGTSYYDSSISKIDFGDDKTINEHISNLTLRELTLNGDLFINIKNVTIIDCEDRDDANISFLKGVNVTGNDMFVSKLTSRVSGSISNFTFLMDHYETITFFDNYYKFEDRESNIDATEVDYSLFRSLNIVYDVGTRYSFTKTNVYLIAQTNQTPNITLSFSLFEYKYERRAQLIFQNWSNTKKAGQIDFYHYDFPLNIVLTEPFLPSTFHVYGIGEVTYITDYTDSLEICVYRTTGSDCPENIEKVAFDEINSFIPHKSEDNITVHVVETDNDNHLILSLGTLNNKQIKFTSKADNKQYLDFDNKNLTVDKKFTSSIFNNFVIGVDQSSKPDFLWFGELQFINCDFSESLKDITLNIDDFNTDYATLYKFKKIVITDNLIVSGDLVDQENTIIFTPDENSEDLKATISENTTITLGEGFVMIGKTKFQIEKSQNFDIILIPKNTRYLEFKLEESDAKKIPLVRIQEASYMEINFTGSWPSLSMPQKYIVSIGKVDKVTIYISSNNVPLECEYIIGDFKVIGLSEDVSISGALKFNPKYNTNIIYGYDQSKLNKCKITLNGGVFFDSNIEFRLPQSNLELYIPTIHRNNTESTSTPSIKFIYYIDNNGNSYTKIDSLDNTKISKNWEVQFQMTGNLDDDNIKKFISEETVLLETSNLIIPTINIDSFYFASEIHGINENTFEIAADLRNNKIVLRNLISPLSVPFKLCYGSYTQCEIDLNSASIDSFYDFLPSGQLSLEFEFHDSPRNHVLDFDVQKFYKLNVSISTSSFTSSGYSVRCNFGQDKITDLKINSMNVTGIDSFQIDYVHLVNKGIILPPTDINGIKNLDIDFSSYSFDLFQTFPNNLTINFNKNLLYTITFNRDGWTIAGDIQFNDTFKQTDFPNLCFNLTGTKRPVFNVEEGVTTIQNVHIISTHKNFKIGPNWNKVTGPELDLTLTQKLNNIRVETFSFPFRPFSKNLMIANFVEFSEDILPLTIHDTLILNDEHYNISFASLIDPDKEHISIDEIIFKGNSELIFEDAQFDSVPAKIQRVIVDESSTGSISSGEIMDILEIRENGTFVVSDTFEAEDSVIKFIWSLNKMPKLKNLYPAIYYPKGVEINFESSTISDQEDEYNSFLYQHSFNFITGISKQICQNWLAHLSFNSPVKYFSDGNDLILNASCNNGNLMIVARKLIPASFSPTGVVSTESSEPSDSFDSSDSSFTSDGDDGDDGSNDKNKMKMIGLIVGVIAVVVLVTVVVIIVFVVIKRRKRGHAILNEQPLNDIESELNPSYDV